MTSRPTILLDTCVLLFVANETKLDPIADMEISEAAHDGRLYISAISAWEIGIGVAKNRLKLTTEPLELFRRFLKNMNAQLGALPPRGTDSVLKLARKAARRPGR